MIAEPTEIRNSNRHLPVHILAECFNLTDDGLLFWKSRPREHFLNERAHTIFTRMFAGKEALYHVGAQGYKTGTLNYQGVLYRLLAHRVVYQLAYGRCAEETVDHINGVRTDNRPCNLRPASYSQNNINRGPMRTNKLGVKGVMRSGNKYVAQIRVHGKRTHLGSFRTIEEASQAYKRACEAAHGVYAWSLSGEGAV